jgi:hypothetical protein
MTILKLLLKIIVALPELCKAIKSLAVTLKKRKIEQKHEADLVAIDSAFGQRLPNSTEERGTEADVKTRVSGSSGQQ